MQEAQSGKSKKPYHKPQLSIYGSANTLTSAAGPNGRVLDNANGLSFKTQ